MNSTQYLIESARTVSEGYHTDIVDRSMLEQALKEGIKTGELIDIAKKSIFYGKAMPEGTDLGVFRGIPSSLEHDIDPNILHAALGIYSEAAELLEAVIKGMQTGNLDFVNLFEEQGDLEWYMAMMYRAIQRTPQEAKKVNIDKLKKRYPEKFTSKHAIERNVGVEREILEVGHSK